MLHNTIMSLMRKIGPFLLALFLCACGRDDGCDDYRQAMRNFVVRISETARAETADFVVVPQNGIELVTLDGTADGAPATPYLASIDGHGQEELFYGYDRDNHPTPASETDHLLGFLRRAHAQGNSVLVTDYCSDSQQVASARTRCDAEGFVSFAAPARILDQIPSSAPYHENSDDITRLAEARNFLYLINPEKFATKAEFVNAVCATNYDLVIMDLFFNDGTAFTTEEVGRMRTKANGGRRLVVCYLSIGEAEDYRYYWQTSWKRHRPKWLDKENPDWKGNYKVHYWDPEWQEIICGSSDSYLNRILGAGFDGVYLDIIDAFEYYE